MPFPKALSEAAFCCLRCAFKSLNICSLTFTTFFSASLPLRAVFFSWAISSFKAASLLSCSAMPLLASSILLLSIASWVLMAVSKSPLNCFLPLLTSPCSVVSPNAAS